MKNKAIIFGSIIVLLAGGIFLMLWRANIMGSDAKRNAGGLVAVNSKGTPMPVPPGQAAAGGLPENTAMQEANGLLVSLTLAPYPPSMAAAGDFKVTLADAKGQAVTGATISIDLTMPGMYMPPNKIDLQAAEAGAYHASGRFTMRGPWRMEVILTIDGKTQSLFFDVWL
jgi:hypothetical protein